MHLVIDKERSGLCARGALRQRHRLGRGGGFIQQRGVGDVEAGQVADHGLEVEQRFQPALADLRLVRRIGGVPRRIFQDVALDHRRQDSAGIALPDQRGEHLVLRRQLAHVVECVVLAQRHAEIERRALPDRGRQRLAHQRFEAVGTDGFQHRRDVARRGTDMAAHEAGGGVIGMFKRRVHAGRSSSKCSSVVITSTPIVVPRESGVPSTPGRQRLSRSAAAYWVARSSRAMTVVGVLAFILTPYAPCTRPHPSGRRVRFCPRSST